LPAVDDKRYRSPASASLNLKSFGFLLGLLHIFLHLLGLLH
jgi:hypothetical protein